MMLRRTWLACALTGALLCTAGSVLAASPIAGSLHYRKGIVQGVDLAHRTLVVDGLRYGFAADGRVEIAGSYGAFPMLAPGMKVEIVYREYDLAERVVIGIRQLPDDTVLDQT